jgi:hypothetical protein
MKSFIHSAKNWSSQYIPMRRRREREVGGECIEYPKRAEENYDGEIGIGMRKQDSGSQQKQAALAAWRLETLAEQKSEIFTTKLCTFSPLNPVSDEASVGILTEKTFTSSTMVDGGWVWASSLSAIPVLFVSVERRRENIISHYILSGSYFLLRVISFSLSGCLIIMAYPDYVYSNSSRGIVRQASRKTLFLSFRGTKTHFKFIKLLPFICFCVSLLPVPLLLARSVGSLPHGSSQEPTKTRRKTRVKRRNVFSTFHLIKLDQIEKSHLMGGGGGDREERKRETAKFSSNKTKIY